MDEGAHGEMDLRVDQIYLALKRFIKFKRMRVLVDSEIDPD
jgi:hypothetical protein